MTAGPITDRAVDAEQIRDLVLGRRDALRAGDAEALARHYVPDAVVFTMAPPLVQPAGRAADPDVHRAWLREKGGRVWAEVEQLHVESAGDLAVSTSLESMGTPPDAPQPFTLWYRSTVVWRRIGGEWRIVHHHQSTPMLMDGSMRAATDLTP